MEYQIVSAQWIAELEKLVNSYLQNGWKPIGGVSYDNRTGNLIQAIMK